MKKALFTLALAAMMLPLSAQITSFPWTEDFENGTALPTGFSVIDNDGDGYNWDYVYYTSSAMGNNGSTGFMSSASYINNVGALTPDNWLILPAFTLPAGSDFDLSWYALGYDNSSYYMENYSVYVSTTGNTVSDFTGTTPVYTGTTSQTYTKYTANLSSYAGQTIYVAFRHHNTTDMYQLHLDDLRIGAQGAPEINISAPALVKINEPAIFTINGAATSYGWYVDGVQQSETSTTLTHTFTTAGQHTVVAQATNAIGTAYDTVTIDAIDCGNIALPYAPDFSASLGCWDTAGATLYGYNWMPTSEAGLAYGQVLSFARVYQNNQWYDISTDSWLISPAITMPATGSYEIYWKARPFTGQFPAEHYSVYVISGANFADTISVYTTTLASNDTNWTVNAIAVPSTVSGDFKVAFRHHNTNTNSYVLILDEIEVRAQGAPVLTLAGPTIAQNNTAVTYSASTNVNTLAWYIDGVQQSETGTSFTHTFTTAGTYTVKAVATSTTGQSIADSVVTTIYSCDPISTFPFTEDFENGLNNCWGIISMDAANDNEFGTYADATAHSGANDFRFSSYSRASTTGDYNQYLITPELVLDANNTYDLKFWYKAQRATDTFYVKTSTTGNAVSDFTNVLSSYTNPATAWTEVVLTLPAATKYVAINYNANYQYRLYVDDLYIGAPTTPSVSLEGPATIKAGNTARYVASGTTQTFSWTVDGVASSETGNVLATSFATAGNHTVIVGATNAVGTSYDTVVTDVFLCPAESLPFTADFTNGFGCWDTVSTTGTRWNLADEVGANNCQLVSLSAQQSFFGMMDLGQDNWIISNEIAMAAGNYEISWRPIAFGAPNYPSDHYSVYVISGTSFADTAMVFSETLTAGDTTLAERVAAIPAAVTGNVTGNFKIAFRHHDCTGGYALGLDSIKVRTLSAPTSVSIQGPSAVMAGASATFTAICPNATSYSWTVDGTAVNETSNVLTTTFTATGDHTISVTATNSVGTSAPATHTVNVYNCDAITNFPWTEDFENGIGGCWTTIDNDGDGYNWYPTLGDSEFGNSFGNGETGNSAISNSYVNGGVGAITPDNWLITPAITLPADGNYTLSWFATGASNDYGEEHYAVYVATGNTVADFTATTPISEETLAGYEWVSRSSSLADYAGQTVYVAFRHYNCTDMYVLGIDDVSIAATSGIEDAENASSVAVYPNPVLNMLNIAGDNIQKVEVIDINGRTVLSNDRAGQLDMSNLAEGVYMVRVISADGIHTQKVVKK